MAASHLFLNVLTAVLLLSYVSYGQKSNTASTGEQAVNQTAAPSGAPEVTLATPKSDAEEAPSIGSRCWGYYDVMGQWDPPFNCNVGIYLFCCGSCFYRFCCQFKIHSLDQMSCSNYDTPVWANTGKPAAPVTDVQEEPDRDRTHMIVYIICGVVAIMVLVGIFTKLGLEKSRGGQTDMTNSRWVGVRMTSLFRGRLLIRFSEMSHLSINFVLDFASYYYWRDLLKWAFLTFTKCMEL